MMFGERAHDVLARFKASKPRATVAPPYASMLAAQLIDDLAVEESHARLLSDLERGRGLQPNGQGE